MDVNLGTTGRIESDLAKHRTEWVCKPDVGCDTAAEETADSPSRPIKKLIRNDDIERPVLLLQAPNSARRQNPLDTKRLQAVDVSPEIQFRGHQPVPRSVSRKKRDTPAIQRTNDEGCGRFAERRVNLDRFAVNQPIHLIQSTASNNPNLNVRLNSHHEYPCRPNSSSAKPAQAKHKVDLHTAFRRAQILLPMQPVPD